jgi:hypothetical protein
MAGLQHPVTPDGRYFVVRGRLWRMADPDLDPERKLELVRDLMRARRREGSEVERRSCGRGRCT